MKKKNIKLCIILTVLLVILGINTCFASSIPDEEYIAKFLINIGVLNGYEDGNLRLNNTITREEFSKIIVLASTFKNDIDLLSPSSPFPDVTKERWSAPYVKVAAINNILKGYPDGQFKPKNNITLEEASVIALRILNYTSNDYGISWPYSQISYAKEKHILDNVTKSAGQNISRQDAINIVYNTLCSTINGQNVKYINLIDYTTIDDVVIIASRNQDSLIDSNKVLTSAGTYNLAGNFDNTVIGSTSTIILNLDNEIVSIIPNDQNKEKYSIISAVSNGIIVSDNGTNKVIDVKSDITTYYKSQKLTLSNAASKIKSGDVVYVFYDNNKQVNYILIESPICYGPYVITDKNFITKYQIDENTVITKNDKVVTKNDIDLFDVIYVYTQTNEIAVYSNKVSGVIEDILPSKRNANSIVISGNAYLLETVDAYNSLQNYSKGDVVTILLGKDGNVVDVMDSTKIDVDDIGLLLSCTTKELKDSNQNSYTAYSASILLTNGNINEYIVDKNYINDINKIVRVSYGTKIHLSILTAKNNISGKVNADEYEIGSYELAKNIEIIEIPKMDSKYLPITKNIYLSRIDNVSLSSDNIVYYTKNDDGKIDNLIITDVTNDMYTCALVLEEKELSEYSSQTSYKLNINGSVSTITTQSKNFNVDINVPASVIIQNGYIQDMNKLNKISGGVSDVQIGTITIKGEKYKLTNDTVVFKRISSGEYLTISVQDVVDNQDKYNISAYYDKSENQGGRIRALVVI